MRNSIWPALAVVLILFAISIGMRWHHLPVLSDGNHQWLTASTVKFVDNWLEDGIWTDRFHMLERPASIEFGSLISRQIYVSYPPGAILPIYLLKLALPGVQTLTVVRAWGLANHLAVVLTLFFVIHAGFRQHAPRLAALLAAVPTAFYIFHTAPMYWHAMVYFTDTAIIPLFTIILALEYWVRTGDSTRRGLLAGLQALLLFVAALTDWLTIPLAMTLLLGRLLAPLGKLSLGSAIRDAFQICCGPFVAVAVFLFHVVNAGLIETLKLKFYYRSGLNNPDAQFTQDFWNITLWNRLDELTLLIVAAGVVAAACEIARRTPLRPYAIVALIAVLTCALHLVLLPNHADNHDFAALKIVVSAAFALPLILANLGRLANFAVSGGLLGRNRNNGQDSMIPAGLTTVALGVAVVLFTHQNWERMFPLPQLNWRALAEEIGAKTGYEDVLVSASLAWSSVPPQKVAISRKILHSKGRSDLEAFRDRLPPAARLIVVESSVLTDICGLSGHHRFRVTSDGVLWTGADIGEQTAETIECIFSPAVFVAELKGQAGVRHVALPDREHTLLRLRKTLFLISDPCIPAGQSRQFRLQFIGTGDGHSTTEAPKRAPTLSFNLLDLRGRNGKVCVGIRPMPEGPIERIIVKRVDRGRVIWEVSAPRE